MYCDSGLFSKRHLGPSLAYCDIFFFLRAKTLGSPEGRDIFLKLLSAFALAYSPTSLEYLTCKLEKKSADTFIFFCTKPSRMPHLRVKVKNLTMACTVPHTLPASPTASMNVTPGPLLLPFLHHTSLLALLELLVSSAWISLPPRYLHNFFPPATSSNTLIFKDAFPDHLKFLLQTLSSPPPLLAFILLLIPLLCAMLPT